MSSPRLLVGRALLSSSVNKQKQSQKRIKTTTTATATTTTTATATKTGTKSSCRSFSCHHTVVSPYQYKEPHLEEILTLFSKSFKQLQHDSVDCMQTTAADVNHNKHVRTTPTIPPGTTKTTTPGVGTANWAKSKAESLLEMEITTMAQLSQILYGLYDHSNSNINDNDNDNDNDKSNNNHGLPQKTQQQIQLEQIFSKPILDLLKSFLPGPMGNACFQLARQVVECVEQHYLQRQYETTTTTNRSTTIQHNLPITKYAHRCKHGGRGREEWIVSRQNMMGPTDDMTATATATQEWKIERMHVDCAGFVRNVLCSVLKIPDFTWILSDRDFMRAKDFFNFFASLPYSVTLSTSTNTTNSTSTASHHHSHQTWKRVDDLRMLLPGDIVVYRREGKAAGGAVFTNADLKDMITLLKAVRTAQLYDEEFHRNDEDDNDDNHNNEEGEEDDDDDDDAESGQDSRNHETAVMEWAQTLSYKLSLKETFGIQSVDDLKRLASQEEPTTTAAFWSNLKEFLDSELCYEYDTVDRLYDALNATGYNTGHIMFAAGLPECVKRTTIKEEYRIPIFHSTGFGRKYVVINNNKDAGDDHDVDDGSRKRPTIKRRNGVERSFKRLTRIVATNEWIRDGGDADVGSSKRTRSNDAAATSSMNHGVVHVVAARMCY